MTHTHNDVTLTKAEVFVFRAPIDTPVRTSFGIMRERPAVFVRLEDKDGACGFGEAWCNFPACGAEHRGRLLETILFPLVLNIPFQSPSQLIALLEKKTRVLRLQCDESGPLAQCMASLDIAMWDLFARREGKALHAYLNSTSKKSVPVYASGINQKDALDTLLQCREEGFSSFKFKIGFDEESDLRTVHTLFQTLLDHESLATDVNQAWDFPTALRMAKRLADFPLLWIEEPLGCDAPPSQWLHLKEKSSLSLAAGENFRSKKTYQTFLENPYLGVIQPDICKWGGISHTIAFVRQCLAKKIRYCPHFLGGAIGLAASAHVLSALGGDGLLEVDVNPNPLRSRLNSSSPVHDGSFHLSEKAGLGIEPPFEEIESMRTFYAKCAA